MSELLDYLVKNDPLKTADGLIQASDFGSSDGEKDAPITFSLLLICSIILALTKTLYGEAGFSFVQHFVSSIIVIFVGYIFVGLLMMLMGISYKATSNLLRCFLTCFMAANTVSLLVVYFADPITDAGVWVASFFTNSDWFLGRFGDAFPALLFSLAGCFAVFRLKAESSGAYGQTARQFWRHWRTFPIYWTITFIVFNYLAFDRGWFFDNVMKQISKIKFA